MPKPSRDDDDEEDTPRTKARIDALKRQQKGQVDPEAGGNQQSSTTSVTKTFSPAIFGRPGGGQRLANAGLVAVMPINVQRAFRIKLLSILLVQLLISLGVAFSLRVTTEVDASVLNRTAVALNLEQHTNSSESAGPRTLD